MKTIRLGSIIVLTLCLSIPSFAKRHAIDFTNKWDHSYRSIVEGIIPFEATLEDSDNTIQFYFKNNVESLTIHIIDSKGTPIYNGTFNASQNETKTISLKDAEKGEYTIIVTDASNYTDAKIEL